MNAAYNDVLVGRQNLEIDKTVRKDRDRLLRFIQTRVRNEDDAQDILQDVFWELIVAVLKRAKVYRFFRALSQIASRMCSASGPSERSGRMSSRLMVVPS